MLNLQNLDSNSCIIIEDSYTCLKSARENEAFCIAFNRYNDPRISNIAQFSIDNYDELRIILGLSI